MTGRVLAPETAALDHIVPRSRGGVSTMGNAQIVLTVVNQAKGTMTPEEFVQLCRDVVDWHDRGMTA
jgi:5-methylcytosine-specific restriction endonuclease McrA